MKILKNGAIAGALVVALAACGSAGGTPSTEEKPAKKADKLVVWRMGTKLPEHDKYMKEANEAYEAKTGTKIEVQWVPWEDATKKWNTAAASGEGGPDVTEMGNTQIVTYAAQDTLADITDKVAGWAEGKEIPQNLWVNETIEGAKYGVPWLGGVRAVVYRKDWFKELKLEIPTTWEELTAAAKTIAEKKKVSGFEINGGSDAMHAFAPFVWGNGGEMVKQEGDKWVSQLNTPQAKEAITWYTSLVTKEKVSPESALTRNTIDIAPLLAKGKVGMYVDGSWAQGLIKDKNKKLKESDIGAFPLPGKTGDVAGQFAGGNDLAVWKDSKFQDDAFEYIKFLASKEQVQKYAPTAGLLPFYPSLLEGDTYTGDEWLGAFAKAMPNGRAYAVNENWVKVEESVVQQMLKDIIKGGKTVDEAAAEAAKQMDQELNK